MLCCTRVEHEPHAYVLLFVCGGDHGGSLDFCFPGFPWQALLQPGAYDLVERSLFGCV